MGEARTIAGGAPTARALAPGRGARAAAAQRLDARDLALGAGLGLAAAALYAATWQPAWYGDGVGIARAMLGGPATTPHPLAMLVPRALERWTPLGAVGALRATSIGGAAVGLAATFLLARALGARRGAALGASLLAALSPAAWFFATVVEVHALHFACVALASLAAVRAGAAARGRRLLPWLGLLATAPLVVPSHASGKLLIPAIGALALVRGGAGPSRSREPRALAAVGAGALVALGIPLALALRARFLQGDLDEQALLAHFLAAGDAPSRVLLEGWLLPLGLILPAALAHAAGAVGREPALAAAIGLAILPEAAVFSWWGWAERGGYAVATLPIATAAVALLLDRRPRLAALGLPLALLLHAALARTWGLLGRDAWLAADRVQAIERALPSGGTLYSLQVAAPPADLDVPAVHERALDGLLIAARRAGVRPEDFGPRFFAEVAGGPCAFDLGCLQDGPLRAAGVLPYLRSLQRAFESRPSARSVQVGDWSLVAVEEPPRAWPPRER